MRVGGCDMNIKQEVCYDGWWLKCELQTEGPL